MAVILYVHGFLSSPKSQKAQITEAWLKQYYPHVRYLCPALSGNPKVMKTQLEQVLAELQGETIYAIGSSLGGFWATYFTEQGLIQKTILVNPAVDPHVRFHEFVGQTLQSYYSEDSYVLGESDLRVLAQCACPALTQHDKYWLMVQTQDETLDYRLAVEKYRQSKQLVEEGGNHSFVGYENWLNDIMRFFSIAKPQ